MESNHPNQDEGSAPPPEVLIEPYRGPISTERESDGNSAAVYEELPSRYNGLIMVAEAAIYLLRGWGRLITHPFRANDQALSWAKQGTAWIALAWLVLVEVGDSGLFYWLDGCAWLLFATPALVGIFYLVRSATIVKHSHRQLITASIIALGLAAMAGLLLASVSVSKAGELLGNLEECCCYLCVKAAVEWYNR
jgi:hypothetical protein